MLDTLVGQAGIVRAPVAPLNAEPRISSPQTSQRLAGHAVYVLEARGDWLRVRGDDAYEGWMHRGFLALDDPGTSPATAGDGTLLSLGCVARRSNGTTRPLPLGALLDRDEAPVGGEALACAERGRHFPRESAAIVRTAVERYAGTPYQWGGITPWGADCSGLVQTVLWLHGLQLPRDAWMQADMGDHVPDGLDGLAPADLLCFSDCDDGKITHVAMAIGGTRIVHSALGRGGYAIDRLDDDRDAYVAALRRRFRHARRLL